LPGNIDPKKDKNWAYVDNERGNWIYEDGEWITNYHEKFKGFNTLVGIKKITKSERNGIIKNNKLTNHGSLTYEIKLDVADGNKTKKKSGCFIATAVYGDENCIEVLELKRIRDNHLNNYLIGRWFVEYYYFISPYLLPIINKSNCLKKIIRSLISNVLVVLKRKG